MQHTRRAFLADVGTGMLIAGAGSSLVSDLGLNTARAAEETQRLTFGTRESLVALLQDTAPNKLLPLLVKHLSGGTSAADLVGAAALANARAFGGEDYIGFHTLMALAPAYHMSRDLPRERRALPILKVLYRNSTRIQEKGGRANEVLQPVAPVSPAGGTSAAEQMRQAVRRRQTPAAEGLLAGLAADDANAAFNGLLPTLHDGCEVHRVVLVSRAWDLLALVGREQAHTLLRQSVRYCVKNEPYSAKHFAAVRALLPQLLERHRLLDRPKGTKPLEDDRVERLSQTFFTASPADAAGAAAEALAEGIAPDAIAEAVVLAANQLVLRDNGRPKQQAQTNKPVGSVHGDSIGVHACDSANAWRAIARVSEPRNAFASILLAAYQVALDRGERGGDFQRWEPYPRADVREKVTAREAAPLLTGLEGAIREGNQALASAHAARYTAQGHDPGALFALLLRFAISEDGALHAEKYFRTASEEYAATRKAFRDRHLIALARVTASAHGYPAPGYAEACALLKVRA